MNQDNRYTRREIAALSIGTVTGMSAAPESGAATSPPQPPPRATVAAGARSAIPYSKFKMYTVVNADLESAPTFPFPFVAGSKFKAVNTGIDEPAVQINFEDFLPGPDIVWSMFHDEVQYVTSGRAEITFHLPPLMQESGTVIAGPGSIYLLPRGARIVWRVLDGKPFRHLCVCIPNPGYPLALAGSAKRE